MVAFAVAFWAEGKGVGDRIGAGLGEGEDVVNLQEGFAAWAMEGGQAATGFAAALGPF
jgi:hypothetical protein